MNYFSGSLPISSSCIWTSVFLACSFPCAVFLYLSILLLVCLFLNLLCLRSPFPSLQGKLNPLLEEDWILSSFWFLPSYSWCSGLCKLLIESDLSWVLFVCLFVFPLMDKAEWGGNIVCWWLFFLFLCLLFRWGVLHRVLLVFGWWYVLYSSGFLWVSSHPLIL